MRLERGPSGALQGREKSINRQPGLEGAKKSAEAPLCMIMILMMIIISGGVGIKPFAI